MSVDICVRCGNELVEDVQVCYECNTIVPVEEMTKEELTRGIMKITAYMVEIETQLSEVSDFVLELIKKVSVTK